MSAFSKESITFWLTFFFFFLEGVGGGDGFQFLGNL